MVRKGYIRKSFADMEEDAFIRARQEDLIVDIVDDTECIVTNIDHRTNYRVLMDEYSVIACECPHHVYRRVLCKHMVSAAWHTGRAIG